MSARLLPQAFAGVCRERPESSCIIHGEAVMTYADVDAAGAALATRLAEAGIEVGDRVAIMTQNRPEFVITVVATWHLGAAYVPLSPMSTAADALYQLGHSGARVLVVEAQLWTPAIRAVLADTEVATVLCVGGADLGAESFAEIIESRTGSAPIRHESAPEDLALLSYTSGTTGRPKAVMTSHANVAHTTEEWRAAADLCADDVVAAIAPLFHITGPPAILGASFVAGIPMVLDGRFDPRRMVELIERHRCTFALASITAYRAMLPLLDGHDLSAFTKIWSGGAPVPVSTIETWQQGTGAYIRNCYGLTETTSPATMVPAGQVAPVDPESGAVSVGQPITDTDVRVINSESGDELPHRIAGELLISGPGVFGGYWNDPEATAAALTADGALRSGDVAIIDENGWVYVVDRLKDMIIASGFKVWPREVEDVLHKHPEVVEAAVVGVPDDYRGETVRAVVECRPGSTTTPDELIAFCRERLAAYKYPREVIITDHVPQTASGKVLRREVRDWAR